MSKNFYVTERVRRNFNVDVRSVWENIEVNDWSCELDGDTLNLAIECWVNGHDFGSLDTIIEYQLSLPVSKIIDELDNSGYYKTTFKELGDYKSIKVKFIKWSGGDPKANIEDAFSVLQGLTEVLLPENVGQNFLLSYSELRKRYPELDKILTEIETEHEDLELGDYDVFSLDDFEQIRDINPEAAKKIERIIMKHTNDYLDPEHGDWSIEVETFETVVVIKITDEDYDGEEDEY